MFSITFHEFRCWQNLSIQAPIGGITLIKGNSGIGKTTILQGITWCLYGNIRLVAPNHMEKAKTHVIIQFPYNVNGTNVTLTINRQKNPNRLILSYNDALYEDKVAQSIIDDLFGTYDIWLASCYIGQGIRNNFLTASNIGKMEMLNSLAFHEEDPVEYIERIDTIITQADADYKVKLSVFTNNLNLFQSILTNTDVSKALTPEQVTVINIQIEILGKEKSRFQLLMSQRDINIGILGNLRSQLERVNTSHVVVPKADEQLISFTTRYNLDQDTTSDITGKAHLGKMSVTPPTGRALGALGNIFEDSINTSHLIDEIINQITEIIPLLRHRDTLELEVKRFDSLLLPYTNFADTSQYTSVDYQDAISKETAIIHNQKLAQSLGVLYSDSVIKETIQKHRYILSSQERFKIERECDTLRSRINALETEYNQQARPLQIPYFAEATAQEIIDEAIPREIAVPDYTKYSTNNLSESLTILFMKQGEATVHIQHLQKGRDVLQCPQCSGSLRYQHGTLILAETGPANLDELNTAQQKLISINAEISHVNQSILALKASESAERTAHAKLVTMEQKRLDTLRERAKQLDAVRAQAKQLEFENQQRNLANQARAIRISDLKDDLRKIVETLETLPDIIADNRKILSTQEIDQTHSLIGRLSNITILVPPQVSSRYIQTCMNYQDLIRQNTSATTSYRDYIETIPLIFRNESIRNIQTYIDKLRTYQTQIKEASEERVRLNRLKISLEDQVVTVTEQIGIDLTAEINRVDTEIISLQQSLILSQKAHSAIKYHTQITNEREEIVALNAGLGDLQTFRQYAVETECRILQQVVDSINASIRGVCGTLFDRDINITLNLFKTMKTNKNVKPVANFNISYQAGIFDNINQMSGGEGDRASLALTLALNRLSSCPLLMLDESLASLDLNMKEAAIRTIMENTNSTVLVIIHDGIEGLFHNVINLDDITHGRY